MRLIDADALSKNGWVLERHGVSNTHLQSMSLADVPTIDAVPVVRCIDCKYCVPLERNCELNSTAYKHCSLWRGEETKNVWHKYQKFYRDYSIVGIDDYCSFGERRTDERKAD